MRRSYLIIVVLLLAKGIFALQSTTLSLLIVDENSALVSPASVKLKQDNKTVKEIIKESPQQILFSGLNQGIYILEIEAKGFKPYFQEIEVKSGKNELTIRLDIATIIETIDVAQNEQEKAVYDAFSNFLTKDQIDGLSDDSDELKKQLKQIAGDPNAIIRVDGFKSASLPPKSQIASIRIVRSSFDAENHELGSVYIDIITKAGNRKFTGGLSFNFNDESLNARNAFSIKRFPQQSKNTMFFLSGPIKKDKAAFSFFVYDYRNFEGRSINAVSPEGLINSSANNMKEGSFVNANINYNLPKDHAAKFVYEFRNSISKNLGVGDFNLAERGFNAKLQTHQLRISESGYIGENFLNEIRFQFIDETTENTPLSDKTAIIVLDAFSNGGAGNENKSRKQGFLLANNLLFGIGKFHAVKVGSLVEYEKGKTESAINRNGTFTFSSLGDYTLGRPTTFTQNPETRKVNLSQMQIGAFIQDDIRLHKSFMLSAGLRYEWQNNLQDKNNFSPRLGFTWSPSKTGKITFRGGAGIYYDWLETNYLATVLSQDITQPNTTVVINPSFPNPFDNGISQILPRSYWQLAQNLKNPYIFLSSIGMERRLNETTSLRVLYKYQKGVHQFRSRDINAPLDGLRPNPSFGRILQVESSAFLVQNSLNIGLNGRLTKNLSHIIDYTLAQNISDADGIFGLPSNNYNLRIDRSVSNLDQRHRIYASLYWKPRKDVTFSTNFIINSPLPYTITTGFDENDDTIFNDRPFGIRRNSESGTWQRQVDISLSWTIGLFKRKDGQSGRGGTILVSSAEAASGDIGIDTKHKYSLKLYTTANNILNQTNFTNFVGVQTSPFFRQPIVADNPRRIELGLRFSF